MKRPTFSGTKHAPINSGIAIGYSALTAGTIYEYSKEQDKFIDHLRQSLIDTRSQLIDSGHYTKGSILIISIDEQIKLAL